MKNSITIDGRTVELPTELIDQIRDAIKPKEPELPTWEDVFKGGMYSIELEGEVCDYEKNKHNLLLSEKSARKLAVFNKLLAVADYLNDGVDAAKLDSRWCVEYDLKSGFYTTSRCLTFSLPPFKSKELALKAIEIFRANGDEQELINFFIS